AEKILCWKNHKGANPYTEISELKSFWANPGESSTAWKAPDGLFWISDKRAYNVLPKTWKGSCTIGTIQPAFFLLPQGKEKNLGVPL
ncbi:ENR1 protein, partial [Certhia brachydactyla]|nr:ENR1 protein [Certhia brachydactyla]